MQLVRGLNNEIGHFAPFQSEVMLQITSLLSQSQIDWNKMVNRRTRISRKKWIIWSCGKIYKLRAERSITQSITVFNLPHWRCGQGENENIFPRRYYHRGEKCQVAFETNFPGRIVPESGTPIFWHFSFNNERLAIFCIRGFAEVVNRCDLFKSVEISQCSPKMIRLHP